jgi:hypothetical protein
MWKYVLAWFPMVSIAIANGAISEGWYGKHVSELQAHQISTVTGVLLFGVYIWVLMRIWRPESSGQALIIGLVWLGMTVAFEFLFGHYPYSDTSRTYAPTTRIYGYSQGCFPSSLAIAKPRF